MNHRVTDVNNRRKLLLENRKYSGNKISFFLQSFQYFKVGLSASKKIVLFASVKAL